jgi:dihydrodipicolinate synthase/N-acetylneuraminate lyase
LITLAQATSVPLILYNIPMLAGNVLGTPAVRTLAERFPRIVGIKDSSGDLFCICVVIGLCFDV